MLLTAKETKETVILGKLLHFLLLSKVNQACDLPPPVKPTQAAHVTNKRGMTATQLHACGKMGNSCDRLSICHFPDGNFIEKQFADAIFVRRTKIA
ncbi:MAG TPA: hypothetical protein VM571_05035 [Noviherbaspirillum sp.]|nr:hypothetical protein [Noviherbaspirillum sp.]